MAGIDRLAEALGRDNDLDPIERDNLCADAADKIKHLDDLVATAEAMQSFIGIMFGEGPDAVIPETVNAPVGVPIKIGDLMRSAATILARAKAQCAVTGVMRAD